MRILRRLLWPATLPQPEANATEPRRKRVAKSTRAAAAV